MTSSLSVNLICITFVRLPFQCETLLSFGKYGSDEPDFRSQEGIQIRNAHIYKSRYFLEYFPGMISLRGFHLQKMKVNKEKS